MAEYDNNNQNYNEENYAYEILNPNGRPKSRIYSVLALIMGILSIASVTAAYLAIVAGVLAIGFSVVSRKKLGYFDGMSIAGLIVGIFGAALAVGFLILINIMDPAVWEEFVKEFSSFYGSSNSQNTPDI